MNALVGIVGNPNIGLNGVRLPASGDNWYLGRIRNVAQLIPTTGAAQPPNLPNAQLLGYTQLAGGGKRTLNTTVMSAGAVTP